MDFIEEGGNVFSKILISIVSLIVPSAVVIYLLLWAGLLEGTGHSFLGTILKGIANFISDIMTLIGKFLLWIITEFTLVIIVLCIVFAFLKKHG